MNNVEAIRKIPLDELVEEKLKLDSGTVDFWHYPNAVPKETCEDIIKFAEGQWEQAGVGGENVTTKNVIKEIRDSQVAWTECSNLYRLVWSYANNANDKALWRFQLDSAQPMQITKYENGGFYNFHKDGNGFTREHINKSLHTYNKTRKLSMSIVLNEDYEGGEFEFYEDGKLIKEKTGTVIVFPSYMLHRVRPVTKGVRYSLVVWFCGEPFV